jgi:hypothetical protein
MYAAGNGRPCRAAAVIAKDMNNEHLLGGRHETNQPNV